MRGIGDIVRGVEDRCLPTGLARSTRARGLANVTRTDPEGVRALDDVSLTAERGTFRAVMGPSGSGKSTLTHCAAGLDAPTGGSVRIDGRESGGLNEARQTELRREPSLGVADNLAAVAASRPDLALEPTDNASGNSLCDTPPGGWSNPATTVVLLCHLLLGIGDKRVAATGRHRNETAALRLSGTTPRQIRSMTSREAATIAAAELTTGVAPHTAPGHARAHRE